MKTAVILGGTIPHINLICQLKDRGYYTLLIDYSENPPAREYADEHIRVSTLDREKVLDISKKKKIDLIISTSVDQANVVACYVAEKLGLPHPYDFNTALDVTDKTRMKDIMCKNNIYTPKHISASDIEELKKCDFRFPVMIKPADSNSANGVKKIEKADELIDAYNAAKSYSRNGRVICEEYVEGTEISAYAYIYEQKAHVIMIQERISVFDGKDKIIKCFASIAPARISEAAKRKAKEVLEDIAKAFNLDNTPLFFQGIVKGDDISVIEFAPRTGGGISTSTMRHATGFDFISAAIDSYLGEKPDLQTWHELKKIHAVNQVYADTGTIGRIEGVDPLIENGMIDIVSFYKREGGKTDTSSASTSRVFVMVVSGEDEKTIRDKIDYIFEHIEVFDANGNSIIRKDLNISNLNVI